MGRKNKLQKAIEETGRYRARREEGHYKIEKKRGVSPKRVQRDQSYFLTRLFGQEFGNAARAGKLLRNAVAPLLKDVKHRGVANAVVSKMRKMLEADTDTLGQRDPGKILFSEMAPVFFGGFDFNPDSPLTARLKKTAVVKDRCIHLLFSPRTDVDWPTDSEYALITGGYLRTEENGLYLLLTQSIKITKRQQLCRKRLEFTGHATGDGLYLLQVRFINRFRMDAEGGRYNALRVL